MLVDHDMLNAYNSCQCTKWFDAAMMNWWYATVCTGWISITNAYSSMKSSGLINFALIRINWAGTCSKIRQNRILLNCILSLSSCAKPKLVTNLGFLPLCWLTTSTFAQFDTYSPCLIEQKVKTTAIFGFIWSLISIWWHW